MAAISKASVKAYFVSGARPTQDQFGDLIDSYQDFNEYLTSLSTAQQAGVTGFVALASSSTVSGGASEFTAISTINIVQGGTNSNTAASARTELGLEIGVDVEAYDPDIARLSAVQTWSRQQNFAQTTLVAGSTISWDLNENQFATVTLSTSGGSTLGTASNQVAGGTYVLIVKQDGTGSRTLTFPANYLFPNGIDPELSTGASAVDILTFVSDGTVMYGVAQTDFQ